MPLLRSLLRLIGTAAATYVLWLVGTFGAAVLLVGVVGLHSHGATTTTLALSAIGASAVLLASVVPARMTP